MILSLYDFGGCECSPQILRNLQFHFYQYLKAQIEGSIARACGLVGHILDKDIYLAQ
jgi:hypothetical protein